MTPEQATILLERYRSHTASEQEVQLVETWYGKLEATGKLQWGEGERAAMQARIYAVVIENRALHSPTADLKSAAGSLVNTLDSQVIPPVHRINFLKTAWFRYAAVLLLIAGAAAYLWFNIPSGHPAPAGSLATQHSDILPGKEGAILTLADGTQMVLDSVGNGVIAQQNGVQVILKDGQLSYDGTLVTKPTEKAMYNMLVTPKGRQFQVILPDGTKVWLNTASSLRFPTVFSGKERKMEVTGEAYFEVAKDSRRPFTVKVNHEMDIEVLGTSFNVRAYENDESIKATLLEGSIKIQSSNIILKPGQQAVMASSQQLEFHKDSLQIIDHADLEQVTAWKNGMFQFKGTGIREVMIQLSRWYNIDISYEGAIPDKKLNGEIHMNVSLQSALKVLEFTGIHFRVEGNKVIVLSQ